eukprot:jgi/Tetstr1/454252/TSEL_041171.t1
MVLNFFKGVAEVFSTLAKLLPNFPKFLMCFIKLLVISLVHMLLTIPGVDYVMIVWLNLRAYLLSAAARVIMPVLMFLFVALVALLDVLTADFTGTDTLGVKMHRVLSIFNTCLNDPRGWFSVRRWHRNNRFVRLFGVYPCMAPCYSGYEPAGTGLVCKRIARDSPEFCTAAAVTRVAEGMPYRPLPSFAVSSDQCVAREAEQLSGNQRLLVRIVCGQPEEYDNEYLRVPCFERYCARPTSDDVGPSTCSELVPYKSRQGPVGNQLLLIFLLLITGSKFFFTMVTSFRSKQLEFEQLSQSFLQDKARVDLT